MNDSYLKGKLFHTLEWSENKEPYAGYVIQYQGEVKDVLFNGLIVVQLFSFLDGRETDVVILDISNMAYRSDKWIKFYDSEDEMNYFYYQYNGK